MQHNVHPSTPPWQPPQVATVPLRMGMMWQHHHHSKAHFQLLWVAQPSCTACHALGAALNTGVGALCLPGHGIVPQHQWGQCCQSLQMPAGRSQLCLGRPRAALWGRNLPCQPRRRELDHPTRLVPSLSPQLPRDSTASHPFTLPQHILTLRRVEMAAGMWAGKKKEKEKKKILRLVQTYSCLYWSL